MSPKRYLIWILLALAGIASPAAQAQYYSYQPQAQYVGIQSSKMNFYAASQRNSNWCWAASIQMVLNYYGVDISQEQIVARTYGSDPYGRLPNWAGSFPAITANLNNWNVDNAGNPYVVASSMNWGAPTPSVLLRELSQGHPVLAGYRSGPGSGHAVVITAASFLQTRSGPVIASVVVRDPWPSPENVGNYGRVEYPGAQFASVIEAYWYIRAQVR